MKNKRNWRQRRKTSKTCKEHGKQLAKSDENNELLLSKEKEIFKEMYSKIIEKIEELNRKSDYSHLKYDFHKTVREIDFSELKKTIVFLDDMKAKKYW